MSFKARVIMLSFTFAFFGAWSNQVWGQNSKGKAKQMTTQENEDFRKKAPEPLASKPLSIPKPFETVLPNGLRVVVLEDKRLPLVSYRLAFRTGSANNPADMPGMMNILAGLLNEGTENNTSKQIADQIARMGATLGAGSTSDQTTVTASALSMYSYQLLELLAAALNTWNGDHRKYLTMACHNRTPPAR